MKLKDETAAALEALAAAKDGGAGMKIEILYPELWQSVRR